MRPNTRTEIPCLVKTSKPQITKHYMRSINNFIVLKNVLQTQNILTTTKSKLELLIFVVNNFENYFNNTSPLTNYLRIKVI